MSRKEGHLSNPAAQSKLREAQRLHAAEQKRAFRDVMTTKPGRRFVWRLITGTCRTFGPSFSVDDRNTNLNEGRRAVGIDLMTEAQDHADLYLQMLTECIQADTIESVVRREAESTKDDE